MSLDLSRLAASGLAALTVSCSAHAATETVTGAFVFSAVVTNTTVTDSLFLDPFSGDPAGLVSATLSIDSRILVNDLTAAEAFASVLLNGTALASMALGQSENFLTFSADLRALGVDASSFVGAPVAFDLALFADEGGFTGLWYAGTGVPFLGQPDYGTVSLNYETADIAPIPLPASLLLLLGGIGSLGALRCLRHARSGAT